MNSLGSFRFIQSAQGTDHRSPVDLQLPLSQQPFLYLHQRVHRERSSNQHLHNTQHNNQNNHITLNTHCPQDTPCLHAVQLPIVIKIIYSTGFLTFLPVRPLFGAKIDTTPKTHTSQRCLKQVTPGQPLYFTGLQQLIMFAYLCLQQPIFCLSFLVSQFQIQNYLEFILCLRYSIKSTSKMLSIKI